MEREFAELVYGFAHHVLEGVFGVPYGGSGVRRSYVGDGAWRCMVLGSEFYSILLLPGDRGERIWENVLYEGYFAYTQRIEV